MAKQDKKDVRSRIRSKVTKIVSWVAGLSLGSVFAAVLLSLVAVAIFAQTRFFQDWLRDQVVEAAQDTLDIEIDYEDARLRVFRLFPELSFNSVKLTDIRTDSRVEIEQVAVRISAFLSVPLFFWNKIYISEARVRGLSYDLETLDILEDWRSRLRGEGQKAEEEQDEPGRFETIVHRISFQDFRLKVDLPVDLEWLDRLQAELRLENFRIRIDRKDTFFSGNFSFSRIDLGDYVLHEGRVSLENSVLSENELRLGQFQLQTVDDFIQVAGLFVFEEVLELDLASVLRIRLENYSVDQAVTGFLRADSEIRGPISGLSGVGRFQIEDLHWRDKTWEEIAGSWRLQEDELELPEVRWSSGQERSSLRATVPLSDLHEAQWGLQLGGAHFGEYLGLEDQKLSNYRGLASLSVSAKGIPFMSRVRDFRLEGVMEGLSIIDEGGSIIYDPGGEAIQLELVGGSDDEESLKVSGRVSPSFADIPVELSLSLKEIELVASPEFNAPEAGQLFDFAVGVVGPLQMRLFGSLKQPRLEIHPNLDRFYLGQMEFQQLQGLFAYHHRDMWAEDLQAHNLKVNGGLEFQPGGLPSLFKQLQFEISDISFDSIISSLDLLPEANTYRPRGLLSAKGLLEGPMRSPTGKGDLSIKDFAILEDRVRGRAASSDWAISEGALSFSDLQIQASREGGLLRGEISLNSDGELEDFDLRGDRVRVNDWFSIFDLQLPFQATSNFRLWQRLSDQSFGFQGALIETSIGGGFLPNSEWNFRSTRAEFDGSASLLGGQIQANLRDEGRQDARLEFELRELRVSRLLRVLNRSNLDFQVSGLGNCRGRRNSRSNLLISGFVEALTGWECSLAVEPSRVLRAGSELHRMDRFEVVVERNASERPQLRVPSLLLRTNSKVLQLGGYFASASDFSWSLQGASVLDSLSYFIPFLNRSSGNLQVDGRWDAEGFHGSVELDDGTLFFQDSPLVVREVAARLRAEESRFDLRALNGQMRDGDIRASGGFELRNLDVVNADIRVQLNGPLLEPQSGLRFRLNGPVELKISDGDALMSGDLEIFEASFRRRMNIRTDLLRAFQPTQTQYRFFEQRESYIDTWRLNIGLKSTQPAVIRNNIADGELDLDLRLVGRIGRPILQGALGVRRGRFTYFNRTFEVESGSVQFVGSPSNIPRYDLRAETRVAEYSVFLNLIGDSEDQRVLYSSDPPLSEREILALVSYGITPAREDEIRDGDVTTQAAFAGISFVTGQLQDTLEGALATDFGIQRLQLFPAFFEETGRTELQLKVGTDLIRNRLSLNYLNFVTAEGGHQVELDFQINRNVSLIGGWREIRQGREQQNISGDFGGDIVFRFEFD
ncbi:MAG: hypothetical protein EA369_01315 [Bradymonadales bacterium]|nr:MAG: hypothetical protein EA369_01315 [Bradymonadales bacterium]